MKIVFDALGFSTASAFILKDGRQMHYGYISNRQSRADEEYEFFPGGIMGVYVREGYITEAEIPTEAQTIAEYRRQLAEQNGAPSINKEIRYAG